MLGGIIIIIGMQVSGKLTMKALRSLPDLFPNAGKPFRTLASIALLAAFVYCSFTCVLLSAVVNGKPLSGSVMLAAHRFMGLTVLGSLAAALLSHILSTLFHRATHRPGQEVRLDIAALLEKSDFIQAKCLNRRYIAEDGMEAFFHALPLKDAQASYLDPANWALPEDEVSLIQAFHTDLYSYAAAVVHLCRSCAACRDLNAQLSSVTDILPPWAVFPLYQADDPGWSTGIGSLYMDAHLRYLHNLPVEQFKVYREHYPLPDYYY